MFFCMFVILMDGTNKNKELLHRLRKNDTEEVFRELFNLYYDRFYRIAVYYLKDKENAREVVSDVFFSLWEQRKKLFNINNFDNYCFILLKNAALNKLEKDKRKTTEALDDIPESKNTDPSPEEDLLNDELLQIYVQTLDDLPPKCREVYILVKEQGLKYAEVADKLDISVKTVDAQLQKAITRLKEKINNYYTDVQ